MRRETRQALVMLAWGGPTVVSLGSGVYFGVYPLWIGVLVLGGGFVAMFLNWARKFVQRRYDERLLRDLKSGIRPSR